MSSEIKDDDVELVDPYAKPAIFESPRPVVIVKPPVVATPAAPEKPETVEPAKPSTSMAGCLTPAAVLIAGLMIAIAILFSVGSGRTPNPDQQTITDDSTIDTVPAGNLKECLLIFIADGSLANNEPEYAATLQDDEFFEWAEGQFKDFEIFDDDDDVAKNFLAKKNATPPIVALIKPDKTAAWVMPLPKGGTDSIREKINGRK